MFNDRCELEFTADPSRQPSSESCCHGEQASMPRLDPRIQRRPNQSSDDVDRTSLLTTVWVIFADILSTGRMLRLCASWRLLPPQVWSRSRILSQTCFPWIGNYPSPCHLDTADCIEVDRHLFWHDAFEWQVSAKWKEDSIGRW